jgi:NAD(P)-dependent dehydrogenase (short-subunit alcohol dehydrogenase family)
MSSLNSTQPTPTRVALITGGAQGIGRAIALRLASDGLDVAVDDIPSKLPLLEEVVNEIKTMGRKAIALTFDVSEEDEVKSMVEKTVAELGRLDAVIHTAADAAATDLISLLFYADGCECRSGWKKVCGGYRRSVSRSLFALFSPLYLFY